ncbi:MAG: Sporulation initiation phosphotransferase F [Firmicutes bacterium ADurb.Bin373]|nr:MAG: Sporulation initiation phosphotransferase F [Firmicutes bacterium ADurb.Bin373]
MDLPYNLLVVDDQDGVRRFLREAFTEEGYNVETAANGAEAVRKASIRPPSLILLDIKMPGMSGLELLEGLRQIAPDALVVIMTAYSELDIITEAKKRGAKCYINKPFDLYEVRYLVRDLLAEADLQHGW